MQDALEFSPLKIKGHCRVELTDVDSGEIEVVEGPNFIASHVLNVYLKQLQKSIFNNVPNGGMNYISQKIPGVLCPTVFNFLAVTDYVGAENPSSEYEVPGNIIGWATTSSTYAGASTTQGTINSAESFGNEAMCHFVFDFPTNAANGTISSVCWCYNLNGGILNPKGSYTVAGTTCVAMAANWVWQGKCPRIYAWVTKGDDGYFYGLVTGTPSMLYKVDPVTFQEVQTYTFPGSGSNSPAHLRWVVHSGVVYYVNLATGLLTAWNLSTLAVTTGVSIASMSICACDGTYLYAVYPASNNYVCRYSMALATVDNAAIMGSGGVGCYYYWNDVFFLNGNLYGYVTSTAGSGGPNPAAGYGLAQINYATKQCTYVGYINDGQIFSDGTNIYEWSIGNYQALSGTYNSNINIYLGPTDPSLIRVYNLMARKLLNTPVVKTSSKTMKIIYEFTFA